MAPFFARITSIFELSTPKLTFPPSFINFPVRGTSARLVYSVRVNIRGGAFDSLFCPEGRVFLHNDCPVGGVLPLQVVSQGLSQWGMVLDEIDTCIMCYRWELVGTIKHFLDIFLPYIRFIGHQELVLNFGERLV